MRIGIIAEGRSDQAVILNILQGKIGIDSSEVNFLRPDLSKDATDEAKFGGWTNVKNDCINKEKFDCYFALEGNEYIVIHLDTSEAQDYNVQRPPDRNRKTANYSIQLRNSVIDKITEWLNNQYSDQLLYAIAIEETEAWILPIYNTSSVSFDVKKALKKTLSKLKINSRETYENYLKLSKKFRSKRNLENCYSKNKSLELFCNSLDGI